MANTSDSAASRALAAAAASGAAGTGASLAPKGRTLEVGVDAVYDLSKRQPGEETPQLEVLPITMYVTEYAERQFSQIAVNGRYICYGLRAGQIRVLHKETASRALLRGHTQHIADMAFSPSKNSDVLASFGMDGNLFVKKIVAPADPNGDIEEKCLLQVTVMTEALPGTVMTPKVRWLSKSKIVASYADGVFIVDVAAAAAASENTEISLYLSPGSFGAEAPDGVTIVSPMAGRPVVTDMSVGPGEAGRLAVAHHDGTLRVWSQAGDTFVQDSTFSPFDETPDAPLASVFFAAPDALVIGGEHNNQLSMWSLPIGGADDMSVSPEHVQTLSFAPSADVYNFAVSAAPGARLVLVSNLKKQALYAVHFGEDAKCGFDYVSEFSTTMPVLSFTALREDSAESDEPTTGGAGTLQLYCMQTQAIQQYALAVDRCRPVSCVGDEAVAVESSEYSSDEESEEEEEEAVPPLAAAPATPAPATPAKPAKQDSASKLLTPGELMSMAAGASNVTPTATAPKEQPTPKAKAAPKAKGAPPPPQAPPPPGGPPPHARGPPPPGPPPFHGPPHGRGPPGHGPPPHGPPPGHLEGLITGLREHIYNDMAGFLAVSAADAREERASREAAERERQKQLLTAVSAAITRDLPVAIEKILKKELGNTVPLIAAALAASSGKAGGDSDDAVAKALPAALAKAMAATVVPKFEKATNEMFQQVKSVFERGMDELAAELYTQKENAVAAEVGPLVHSLRAASDEVRAAAELLMSGDLVSSGAGAGAPSSLADLESHMDPTIALDALVTAGDMEGAFTKALGLSSVDMVAWVCERAERSRGAIFGASPVGLSQGVLLSLAQQLSSDLVDEPNLKISWIRDAALAIDPSDAALAQHMRPILESVFGGLHDCATQATTPAKVKNDLRLCIHVVNSLLTACK